jgi:adenylate cyclase
MQPLNFRLRPSIVLLFVSLVIPFFVMMVGLSYIASEKAANLTAEEMIDRFNGEIVNSLQQLLDPITTLVHSAAVVESTQPGLIRGDSGKHYLRSILDHSADIASVYMGFEDGSFRAVYKASPALKFQNLPSPENSVVAYRWLDRSKHGIGQDILQFGDAQGNLLQERATPASYDPRRRQWYQGSAQSGKAILSDPYIFASNGLVGVSVTAPVMVKGVMQGVVASDLSLDTLGRFLHDRQISAHSQSVILDGQMRLIAASSGFQSRQDAKGQPTVAQLQDLASDLPRVALMAIASNEKGVVRFVNPSDERVYFARLTALKSKIGAPWKILIVAPQDDFLPLIKKNNLHMGLLGVLAVALQLVAIFWLSRKIAKPLETLSHQVVEIEKLRFDADFKPTPSHFSEIAALSDSVEKMSRAIAAFAAFVPVDVVRGLLKSKQKLALGGHSRFLTVMFCDLESFSTLSEKSPSQELLLRVSKYLEVVTQVVNEEQGTLDKFIGDGVMAFWGAPEMLEDHAWHACVAAIKIQQRMNALNQAWVQNGLDPLNVRIGIHCDAVLVGNIGSPQRMSYTVMGDGVNVAARLEGVNKDYGTRICVSHAVFREAGERLCLRPMDDVQVKGRRSTVPIYELLGAKGAGTALEASQEHEELVRMSARVLELKSQGDLEGARQSLRALLEIFPQDPVGLALLRNWELQT